MPFDGSGFSGGRSGSGRGAPRKPSDNVISLLIVGIALALLVLPISVSAFADVVTYLRR